MTPELTEFERKILREVAGLEPPSPWGAAVGEALSFLHHAGYTTRKFGGELTERGKSTAIHRTPSRRPRHDSR